MVNPKPIHLSVARLLALAAFFGASPAAAQTPAEAGSVVRGVVMDAASGAPLAGATVRLLAAYGPDSTAAGALGLAITDGRGAYRLAAVPPGDYRLVIEQIGYRTVTVGVRIGRPGAARVSVGLQVEPVALEPMDVVGRAAAPYRRTGDPAVGATPTVRLRQRRYLSSDVRALTHGEVLQSVTMGEADVFRALRRLPGVSTRDDWSAELWTRGARWDQTRVMLDELPLFSPIHGAGLLAGVNSDAIGSVFLHPGVRPTRLGGGGAAVLELGTRPAHGSRLYGFGEVSLASARAAVSQPIGDGGWTLAGRRTYLDWLSRGFESGAGDTAVAIPFRYSDLTARVDWPLGPETRLEASGILTEDVLTGSIPDVVHASRAVWGNRSGRITVETPLAGVRTRHTLGATVYSVDTDTLSETFTDTLFRASRVEPLHHRLTYAVLRGEVFPNGPWTAGYEATHQSVRAVGTPPSPYIGGTITALDSLDLAYGRTQVAAWVDARGDVGPMEIRGGLRAEAGSPVRGSGRLRLAPRLRARWRATDRLTMGWAAGRSYQYAQSPIAVGLPLDVSRIPLFPAGAYWALAGDTVPALRTDLFTAGGEYWIGATALAALNVYLRRGAGLLTGDPRPGLAVDRPLYVEARESGRGVEVSVRRLAGRWTGSLGYALAWTELEAEGLRYPAPQDRRHTVDVTSRFRITDHFIASGAFTFASGAPYTRFIPVQLESDQDPVTPVFGQPSGRRGSAYASVDLSLEWSRRFRHWGLGLFVQVRNALNRGNAAGYRGSELSCGSENWFTAEDGMTYCLPSGTRPKLTDQFLTAAPTLPLLGLRIEF